LSRWSKSDDDRPLTDEEFEEMRLAFEREKRSYHERAARGDMSWLMNHVTKKASRRELRYLEKLEEMRDIDSLFGPPRNGP
jgi:hypothetical protein